MNHLDFKKEIDEGKIKKFYIFVGEERELMHKYIEKLQGEKIKSNNLALIIANLTSKGLFSNKKVFIIEEDKQILNQEYKKLKGIINQTSNIVILKYDKIDNRLKFFKDAKNDIYNFDKLDLKALCSFIKKEIKINEQDAALLALRCGSDLSRIILEIDKLKMLEKEINEHLINDLIYMEPEDAIFSMIESICKKDIRKAFDYYEDLKRLKESPIKIITLLYNNFRNITLIQTYAGQGMGAKDIAARTGINGWLVGKMMNLINIFNSNQLIQILRLIQNIDADIKGGKMDIDMSIDYLLTSIEAII